MSAVVLAGLALGICILAYIIIRLLKVDIDVWKTFSIALAGAPAMIYLYAMASKQETSDAPVWPILVFLSLCFVVGIVAYFLLKIFTNLDKYKRGAIASSIAVMPGVIFIWLVLYEYGHKNPLIYALFLFMPISVYLFGPGYVKSLEEQGEENKKKWNEWKQKRKEEKEEKENKEKEV